MSERLPQRVIPALEAVRTLPWGAKALLRKIHQLDRGDDGCWLSAAELAERVGVSQSSVEKYLATFERVNLLTRVKRPGSRRPGWRFALPDDCIPDEGDDSLARMRDGRNAIEAHIRKLAASGKDSGSKADSIPVQTAIHSGSNPEPVPVMAGGGGTSGGESPAVPSGKAAVPMQLPGNGNGTGAVAPKRQEELPSVTRKVMARWAERRETA